MIFSCVTQDDLEVSSLHHEKSVIMVDRRPRAVVTLHHRSLFHGHTSASSLTAAQLQRCDSWQYGANVAWHSIDACDDTSQWVFFIVASQCFVNLLSSARYFWESSCCSVVEYPGTHPEQWSSPLSHRVSVAGRSTNLYSLIHVLCLRRKADGNYVRRWRNCWPDVRAATGCSLKWHYTTRHTSFRLRRPCTRNSNQFWCVNNTYYILKLKIRSLVEIFILFVNVEAVKKVYITRGQVVKKRFQSRRNKPYALFTVLVQ